MSIFMNVNSCCCGGFSLRVGTQILLWVAVVIAILQLFTSVATIPMGLLLGIFSAIGLFGISERKPALLLPCIILNVIQIALYWITWAVLIAICLTVPSQFDTFSMTFQDGPAKDHTEKAQSVNFQLLVVLLLLGIAYSMIMWYFTSVIYQYYKQLESEVYSSQGGNISAPPRSDAQLRA